jgi:hypothetical protein
MSPPSLASLRGENLFDLTGVVAVVTGKFSPSLSQLVRTRLIEKTSTSIVCIGGASGIGLMIASTLLANHAKVYIVDLDRDQVEKVAKNYNDLNKGEEGEMIGLQADCGTKVSYLSLSCRSRIETLS